MADFPLIAPDHRLLGWGMTDLTLYGGQPLPGMAIGPARDVDADAQRSTALAGSERPGSAPTDARLDAGPADGTDSAIDLASPPFATVTNAAPVSLLHAPDPTLSLAPERPSVPLPVGSGCFSQPVVATPMPRAEHGYECAGPSTVASAITADSATYHLAPLAAAFSAGGPGFFDAVATSAPALAGLAAAADPLTHATLPPGSLPVLGTAPLEAVSHETATTVNTASHGVGVEEFRVPSPSSAVPSLPADAAASVLHAAVPDPTVAPALTSTTADAIEPVLHVATAVPDATAAPAADAGLSGFGGANPAAGIATLVGMVDSVDAFHLDHALAPAPTAMPAPSILDALAADDHAPALLGNAHAVDHPADDHHGIHVGV